MIEKFAFALAALTASSAGLAWAADSTLCEAAEKVVWSCHAAKKTYSVCASPILSKSAGYMQYRVGSVGKLEFSFPATREHPMGHFEFNMLPHGGTLAFKNASIDYTIAEDLKGLPTISVDKDDRQLAVVHCKDQTGDLLDNATLDLFKQTGVSKD